MKIEIKICHQDYFRKQSKNQKLSDYFEIKKPLKFEKYLL